MTPDWHQIAHELKRETGFSERELAILTGMNRTTLRRFYAGKTPLKVDMLERLLSAFGYSLDAVRVGDPLPRIVTKAAEYEAAARRREIEGKRIIRIPRRRRPTAKQPAEKKLVPFYNGE